MITLICKKEALNDKGEKIMQFTKGKKYDFYSIEDPKGWEVFDDDGYKEKLFDLSIMFDFS